MRVVLTVLLLAGLAACDDLPGSAASNAKAVVSGSLSDPGSAQFRNVHQGKKAGAEPLVCGEVNAKNRYGGYPGFLPFIVSGKSVQFQPTDAPTLPARCTDGKSISTMSRTEAVACRNASAAAMFSEAWNSACK